METKKWYVSRTIGVGTLYLLAGLIDVVVHYLQTAHEVSLKGLLVAIGGAVVIWLRTVTKTAIK